MAKSGLRLKAWYPTSLLTVLAPHSALWIAAIPACFPDPGAALTPWAREAIAAPGSSSAHAYVKRGDKDLAMPGRPSVLEEVGSAFGVRSTH